MNLINESQILDTWSPIIESQTGITSGDKLKWMSKYAHFHSLNEGFSFPQASLVNTPGMGNVAPATLVAGGAANFYGGAGALGSGDKFPSLLPLAIQIAARTIGFEIVPVIPMNGPAGVLTYLDYVYAGGRDINAPGIRGQQGLTGTSAFTDKMQIFKLAYNGVNATTQASLTGASVGANFVFSSSTGGATGTSTPALLVSYVGRSRVDGGFIFETIGETTGLTSIVSQAFTALPSNSTQSVAYASVLDGSATGFTATSSLSGTTYTATFGGVVSANGITGVAELVRALEDHVQGYAGAGPQDTDPFNGNNVSPLTAYEPMRRGVGETTQYRTMGLQAFTKFVEAETFQVAATVTTEQIQDLNRQYGIDVTSMMENALINEVTQSINKHILYRAFALGWQNHYDVSLVESTNFNLNLGNNSINDAVCLGKDNAQLTITMPDIAVYGGGSTNFENQGTFQRRIQSKVLAAANMVMQRGRRGPANFVVTNLQLATALQDSAQFTFYPLANTINQNNGALYPLGTLAGMTVYVDPNMSYNDTRVCVGRKGADEEPGLKFMPYILAESIQTIAEGTMAPKIAVKSRYALVEAGFHPQTQYLTFVVNTFSSGSSWNSGSAPINIA
jgi:hypothetical protein